MLEIKFWAVNRLSMLERVAIHCQASLLNPITYQQDVFCVCSASGALNPSCKVRSYSSGCGCATTAGDASQAGAARGGAAEGAVSVTRRWRARRRAYSCICRTRAA